MLGSENGAGRREYGSPAKVAPPLTPRVAKGNMLGSAG